MSNLLVRDPLGKFAPQHLHDAGTDVLGAEPGTSEMADTPSLQAKQDADLAAVKRVAGAIRSQWPDSEHAFARIEDDGSITMTHVLDAFEGLHADEQDLRTRLGDGTDVHAELAGVGATGDWTTNTAKRMLHGGPPNQKTLRIDLYEAAALRTAPEQRLDLARDDVSDQVLAQYPDADSWEADFEWNSADERFTVADEIYVSAGNRYGRINLRGQDPALLGELTEAAHGALTDIDEDTRYCAQIPGPYLTAGDHLPF
jgi:hypothetical protein